jgi:hypothetical protein
MEHMMRIFAGLALGLLFAAPVQAQTACPAPCTLTVGQSFSASATHDGANAIGYRVWLDGKQVGADIPLAQLANGSVTVAALTAPARGSHSLQFSAFNEDNDAKSPAFPFTVKKVAPVPPGVPSVFTVTVTADASGRLTFQIAGVQ